MCKPSLGDAQGYEYARTHNPTRHSLQQIWHPLEMEKQWHLFFPPISLRSIRCKSSLIQVMKSISTHDPLLEVLIGFFTKVV